MVGLSAAAGGGIVEGDYTSWAKKWLWAPSDGFDTDYKQAFYMDEVNGVFYLWWLDDQGAPNWATTRFGVYNIEDHSIIFESPPDVEYVASAPYVYGAGDRTFRSDCSDVSETILRSHQTYILLSRWDAAYYYHTIEVWRAGVKLWSRDIRADTGGSDEEFGPSEISLTGKYILGFSNDTNKLLLYEGL